MQNENGSVFKQALLWLYVNIPTVFVNVGCHDDHETENEHSNR